MSKVVDLNRTWQGEVRKFVFTWRDSTGTPFSFVIEAHSQEHAQKMLSDSCTVQGQLNESKVQGDNNG